MPTNPFDMVVHLADPRPRKTLFPDLGVDTDSDHLSIYLRNTPVLDTDIALLGVEETGEAIDYCQEGTHWVNFLPFSLIEEMVEGGVAAHKSPVDIATRVLEYARVDA